MRTDCLEAIKFLRLPVYRYSAMSLSYRLLLLAFVCIHTEFPPTIIKKKAQYDLKLAPLLFKNFMETYSKTYTGEEKERRYKVFVNNLQRINAINRNFPGDWVADITRVADLSYLEFVKMKNITEEEYASVNSSVPRKVINCTERRSYLFERFATEPPHEEDYYYSDEDVAPAQKEIT